MKLYQYLALFFISLGVSTSAFAQDADNAELQKQVLAELQAELNLSAVSDETAEALHESFRWALSGDWTSQAIGSASMDTDGISNTSVRFYDLMVTSSEGHYVLSYLYFPEAGQIVYSARQIAVGSSDEAVDLFEASKAESTSVVEAEQESFGSLSDSESSDFTDVLVANGGGAVVYTSYAIIEVN